MLHNNAKQVKSSAPARVAFASQNKEDYYEQRRERKADDRQDG